MDSLPDSIGKYGISRLLGEGAMGLVYEGVDRAIDRKVAIKTLHQHLITKKDGKDFLERFQREAKSAARCTHPNIVTILEYGEDGGLPFIAMEYIDGLSLHDILQLNKKISLKNTLSIVSQILKAINAAHKLGVIHRDIKTANIIHCKESKTIKLADFGIARFSENNSMTLTGAIVGTPRYMAPEQMFGLKADERADLFSVAMVFIELLTAMPETSSIPTSSLPILEGLPQNNKINYSFLYPTALIPVLQKGLASKATDRFQNAKEFAAAIQQAIQNIRKNNSQQSAESNVTSPSSDVDTINHQDLDSLTSILSSYIGPVAKNVLREQSTHHLTLSGLVSAVSQEIPESSQRKEFIKSWERERGKTSLSLGGSMNSHNQSSHASRGSSINVDENTIQKISQDYINYIGPFAPRMVDYYCQNSTDKEQFIQNLASEIPDQKTRDEFTKKWGLA